MHFAHNLSGLSSLIAQYAQGAPVAQPKATVTHIVPEAPTAPTNTDIIREGEKKNDMAPAIVAQPGTMSARQFLAVAESYNVCWTGERETNTHTTPVKGAGYEQMRQALGAYVGWNPALTFGAQVLWATRLAHREVNGDKVVTAPTVTYKVLNFSTIAEREVERTMSDLSARMRIAQEAINAFAHIVVHGATAEQFAATVNDHLEFLAEDVRNGIISATTAANVREVAAKLEDDARSAHAALRADKAA